MAQKNLDKNGNPIGTTYTEAGIAQGEGDNLKNLPEGKVYNEDGSEFTLPENSGLTTQTLKADIAGMTLAITKQETKLLAAKEMAADADAEDKPIFEKNINSVQIAIDSNKASKAKLELELKEHLLKLVTPTQRADMRRIEVLETRIKADTDELTSLRAKMKIVGANASTPPKPKENPASTDEQTALRNSMIATHGTQGKAIVHLIKEGKTNTEIYKMLGIPPASVPGPKNAWVNSDEGKLWESDGEGRFYKK